MGFNGGVGGEETDYESDPKEHKFCIKQEETSLRTGEKQYALFEKFKGDVSNWSD